MQNGNNGNNGKNGLYRAELFTIVARQLEGKVTPRQVQMVIEAMLTTITVALQMDERVTVTGFGTFEVRDRQERTGTNPQSGEPITIPAHRAAAFSASTVLRRAVNNEGGQPEPPAAEIIRQVLSEKHAPSTEIEMKEAASTEIEKHAPSTEKEAA